MASHLEATVARDPYDARARLQLAKNCLQRFENCQQLSDNPMSLASIREAAVVSRFASKEDQDRWLAAATGEHLVYLRQAFQHANCAVRLCPLEGTAYLYLAELAFLQGGDSARDRLIAQALAVRPFDGVVLYTAGYEAMRTGDVQRASDYYRRSFQRGPETQCLIIESLAPYVLPEAFVEFFAPDTNGLSKLFDYYRVAEQPEAARLIGQHYVRSLETQAQNSSGSVAAGYWNTAQEVHDYLRDKSQALAAARQAVAAKPEDFHLRFQLASQLHQAGKLTAALQEFRWCQRRRPEDRTVRARLAEVETHLTP
jgi:tetratricopeptide (TPR) repeat protein